MSRPNMGLLMDAWAGLHRWGHYSRGYATECAYKKAPSWDALDELHAMRPHLNVADLVRWALDYVPVYRDIDHARDRWWLFWHHARTEQGGGWKTALMLALRGDEPSRWLGALARRRRAAYIARSPEGPRCSVCGAGTFGATVCGECKRAGRRASRVS